MVQENILTCEFIKIPRFEYLRKELQFATAYLQDHRLQQSAKWAGELLIGISKPHEIAHKEYIIQNTDMESTFDRVY